MHSVLSFIGVPLTAALFLFGCGGGAPAGGYGVRGEVKRDDELAVQLAETFIEAGALQNAVPILRAALARHPRDARLHYLLGTALRDKGVLSQAKVEFILALELNPNLAPAHSGLGILLDLTSMRDLAAKHHEMSVKLAPHVARFRNNLGFSYYLNNKPKAAVLAYEEALRLDPTAKAVFVNYGFALAADKRDKEALLIFKQALPEAAALNNLALARELRGDADTARQAYLEALGIQPGLRQAIANLEALDTARARNERKASVEETP